MEGSFIPYRLLRLRPIIYVVGRDCDDLAPLTQEPAYSLPKTTETSSLNLFNNFSRLPMGHA
jgi:hypothetical protein